MKKKIAKRLTSLILALCMIGICLPAAMATDVDINDPDSVVSRLIGVHSGIVSIDITSSGRSICYGDVTLKSGYTANLTLYLQRSSDGESWKSIKNWSTSGSGELILEKTYYVVPGYKYRTATAVNVFDSDGVQVETVTKFSGVKDFGSSNP